MILTHYTFFLSFYKASLFRVIKVNSKEWWIILLGLLGSLVSGSIWPLFALLLGEILEVFARPADEILGAIHLWAGLFLVVGVVSGAGVFLKVHSTVYIRVHLCIKKTQYTCLVDRMIVKYKSLSLSLSLCLCNYRLSVSVSLVKT